MAKKSLSLNDLLMDKLPSTLASKGFAWRQELLLYGLAVVIGLLTALAAVGFNGLIEWVDALCYGSDSTPGIYGERYFLLFILPAAGALLVGLIAHFYSREAVGHGVPEVMDAIVRRDCKIKIHVALARIITAALTIGSGGSAGPEGPIIQIGAAIASSSGRFFRVVRYHLPVLIACGAAAGVAAIFHAPIAGVLFAMEVFLRDINFKTLSPVLIASVISRVVVTTLLGADQAIFPLGDLAIYTFHWLELGNYIVLGFICAAVAVAFIRLLTYAEEWFEKRNIPEVFKPMLGGLALGVVGLATVIAIRGAVRGEPIIFGKGYSFVGLCIGTAHAERFADFQITIGILVVLLIAKILATCLTLGSGASGGVFAPSLFMGAATGYAFGLLVQRFGFFPDVSPSAYSVVGMASVVAATTHAPMAAIVMLFEITHNYRIILPVMFSCTVALLIARLFCAQSVATLRLQHRGVQFGVHARTAMLRRFTVRDIMEDGAVIVRGDRPIQEIIIQTADEDAADFVVLDKNGRYTGLLCEKDLRNTLLHPEAIPLIVGDELARPDVPVVSPDDTLDAVLEIFSRLDVNSLPVSDGAKPPNYIGMVTRAALMRRYMSELQNGG
ncbi:MAG TPA: CBS domain-containing protein [Phycisphaerales bacterium]|nr:CBS domain-containing protein [Phycisphaerales bacterium]